MKKTIERLGILLVLGAASSFGATQMVSGKLMDASCFDGQKTKDRRAPNSLTKTCVPTASTTTFALRTSSGRVYKVDNDSGNAALAKDVRDGVLKTDKDGDIHASISGRIEHRMIRVDSVDISK